MKFFSKDKFCSICNTNLKGKEYKSARSILKVEYFCQDCWDRAYGPIQERTLAYVQEQMKLGKKISIQETIAFSNKIAEELKQKEVNEWTSMNKPTSLPTCQPTQNQPLNNQEPSTPREQDSSKPTAQESTAPTNTNAQVTQTNVETVNTTNTATITNQDKKTGSTQALTSPQSQNQ